jgi:hypothetical protein
MFSTTYVLSASVYVRWFLDGVYADRRSMPVVAHHDDLFSWKKNNDYMHVNNVWQVRMRYKKMSFEVWK